MAKQNKQSSPFDPVEGFFNFLGGLGQSIFGAPEPFEREFSAPGELGLDPAKSNIRGHPGQRDRERFQVGRAAGLLSPVTTGQFDTKRLATETAPATRGATPGPSRPAPPDRQQAAPGRTSLFSLGERAFQANPDFSTFAAQQGFLPAPGRGPFKGERGGVPPLGQTKPTTGGAGARATGGTINLIPSLQDTAIDAASPAGVFLNMIREAQAANPGFDPLNVSGRTETDVFDPEDITDSLQQLVDFHMEQAGGDPRLALLRFQNSLALMLAESGGAQQEFDQGALASLGPGAEPVPEQPTPEEAVFGSIVDPRFLRQPSTEF